MLTVTLHRQEGFLVIKCVMLFTRVTIYILLQENILV